MIATNQFKSGMTLEYEGDIYVVMEYEHVKPGKGGAFCRTKLKNLRSKKIIDRTFRAEEKFPEVFVEGKKAQYLYRAADTLHFMDQKNYEEITVSLSQLEGNEKFLKENMDVEIVMHQHEVIEVLMPIFVQARISHTEPGIKGDTARNTFKSATIETGAIIQVPLFINENDVIKIDTRSGDYVERVSS